MNQPKKKKGEKGTRLGWAAFRAKLIQTSGVHVPGRDVPDSFFISLANNNKKKRGGGKKKRDMDGM